MQVLNCFRDYFNLLKVIPYFLPQSVLYLNAFTIYGFNLKLVTQGGFQVAESESLFLSHLRPSVYLFILKYNIVFVIMLAMSLFQRQFQIAESKFFFSYSVANRHTSPAFWGLATFSFLL